MTDRQVFPPLVLRAQGLTCGRSGVALVENLDFSVRAGHCLLLRGPNGTGKTTLLQTLAGIVAPSAGRFDLENVDPESQNLHYCGHRNAIKPRLSVKENLAFWATLNGSTGMSVTAALDEIGLGGLEALDAGFLSAGQSRRLALGRLLVSHRPVWLLDEPTATLDIEGHELVARLIDRHLDRGGLTVAATHDLITLPDASRMETLALGDRT